MREALKRLTSESVVYGLGQVGGRAVQLVLVPILTRALAPAAFGVWELVLAYSQTAVLVLVMGMDGALARFFYQEPDRAARIRMVSTSLLFRLVATVLVSALLVWLAAPLADHLIGDAAYRKYLAIGAATLPVTLIVLFSNDVLRVTFQPWKFIALNMTQTVLVTVLTLWMVLRMDLGVVGVLYGRLIGDAVAAVVGLVLIRHTLRPRFDRAILTRMLAYGVPLIPAAIGFGWIAGIDRYVLQRTRSLEEVAIYAVAAKFFAVVTIAASAFQLAYGPFAFARAQTPEAPRLYARVLAAYMAAGSLGALLVAAFAPELLAILVPAAYQQAALPALWLSFAAVALGTYTVSSVGVGLALKTRWLGLCAGGAALIATLLNAWLTPRYGAPGAALATLAGYGTGAALTYVVAQRVYPLPYRGGRAIFLFALAAALAFVAQRAGVEAGGVAIKLAAIAAFVGVCVRMRIWKESGAVAAAPVRTRGG